MAYDRPGVGGSPRAATPQTGEAAVRTLRQLLLQIDVLPPYVLVGHSFGGLHAQLFARQHPDEVASVLFLEATVPEDIGMMQAHQTGLQRTINAALKLFVKPDANDEIVHERETVAQLQSAPDFPDIPVVVISGSKKPPGWMADPQAQSLRDRNQQALAKLSPQGERVLAPASGHFPQMSEPALVLDGLRTLLGSVDWAKKAGQVLSGVTD